MTVVQFAWPVMTSKVGRVFADLNLDSQRYILPSSPTLGGFPVNKEGLLAVNVAFLGKGGYG